MCAQGDAAAAHFHFRGKEKGKPVRQRGVLEREPAAGLFFSGGSGWDAPDYDGRVAIWDADDGYMGAFGGGSDLVASDIGGYLGVL